MSLPMHITADNLGLANMPIDTRLDLKMKPLELVMPEFAEEAAELSLPTSLADFHIQPLRITFADYMNWEPCPLMLTHHTMEHHAIVWWENTIHTPIPRV